MRNYKLAMAVAGIMAGAAANAANVDLYIAGASAQSSFWKTDFGTSICGGVTNVKTYNLTGVSGISNEAWRCTASSATGALAVGDQVTVHYNSHFGSISGAAALLRPSVAKRLYVNPDSADCPASPTTAATGSAGPIYSCTISSYSEANETFTSPNSNVLVVSPNTKPADVVVLDVELKHWTLSANWQSNNAFGLTTPTAAELAAVTATPTIVNGQVFSVIVNNGGPLATVGNISKESLKAIVTGNYDVWGDVPEVGGGNTTAIKYCRREQGSGTQVAASIFLTGYECGRSSTQIVTAASKGNLTSVTEETSTGSVRSCVAGTTGAIGIASLSKSSSYTTLSIDGVEANAHNAAIGAYTFAFEDIVYNQSASSGAATAAKDLANLFVLNARKAATLPAVESTGSKIANGTWTASSPKANYALPGFVAAGAGGTNAKTVAAATTTSTAVTALTSRGGDNCKTTFNTNTQ